MENFIEKIEDLGLGNKTRISNKVSEIIIDFIIGEEMKPGEKLPSENQLAKTLGVSSRSIREALKILEAKGIIEIHQGKGAFLIDNVYANFMESLSTSLHFTVDKETLILNLVEFREMIETAVIESVAANRTDEDLNKFESIIIKIEEASAQEKLDEYNTFDMAFHKTLIDCSNNNILISFYNVLLELISESFKRTGHKVFTHKKTEDSHRDMFVAIQEKNPLKAKELIKLHIQETKKTLLDHIASEKTGNV